MTSPTGVAAFDVDGTLTMRDCVVPFMREVRGTVGIVGSLVARGHRLVPAVLGRDRDRLKELGAAAAFTGLRVDQLHAHAVGFGTKVAAGWLRDDTVARLGWHRDQGHHVVLVSASFEVYLRHVGEYLGASGVLGTRLEVVDGSCTGRLDGSNCRGPEKVHRLHQWLDHHHGGRQGVELWAYGDSAGDRELLADADHPIWATDPISNVFPRV